MRYDCRYIGLISSTTSMWRPTSHSSQMNCNVYRGKPQERLNGFPSGRVRGANRGFNDEASSGLPRLCPMAEDSLALWDCHDGACGVSGRADEYLQLGCTAEGLGRAHAG